MKFNFHIFIYSVLLLTLAACTTDYLSIDDNRNPGNEYLGDNQYEFNLIVEDPNPRTRTVNFEASAGVRINQIWMGVYDIANGKRVSFNTKNLAYQTILSGERRERLFQMELPGPDDESDISEKGYIIVAFVNYLGVTDEYGEELEVRLSDADTWQKFNDIAVNTNSAYSDLHNSIAPVMAGFLYNYGKDDYDDQKRPRNTIGTHIKIDQFREEKNPSSTEIFLSPESLLPKVAIRYTKEQGFDVASKTLRLRRLVANINVSIELTDEAMKHLALTGVSYKRFNMPKAVYIIERRTTDCSLNTDGSIDYTKDIPLPMTAAESPNYADKDPQNLYYNDADWIYGNTGGFSFQHFANKHWARNEVTSVKDRERCTKYGTYEDGSNKYYFHALVGDAFRENYGKEDPGNEGMIIEDFNNYASYFVIKMHLVDYESGQALEAEYTIHEGYTSDELGDPILEYLDENKPSDNPAEKTQKQLTRLKDFVVARNIDYYYNVKINGVNDIYHNVSLSSTEADHNNGQGGKVWKFYYANDNKDVDGNSTTGDNRLPDENASCFYRHGYFVNPIPPEGGYYKNAIKINNTNPDVAFRLYAYDKVTGSIHGYNYNFPQESFTWLTGLWPPSAGDKSRYFYGYQELVDNYSTTIPENILNGLVIIDNSNKASPREMNIVQFLDEFQPANPGDVVTVNKTYDIKILPTNINEEGDPIDWINKDRYVRAIYIADRNGVPDPVDGCTKQINVFAAAQYPYLGQEPEPDVEKTLIWLPSLNPIKMTKYKVIDGYMDEFFVPTISGIGRNVYSYIVKVGGQDVSNYGEYLNGNYVYNIPLSAFSGDEVDITLQLKLNEGFDSEYKLLNPDPQDASQMISESQTIGSITRVNHNTWEYGANIKEWNDIINYVKGGKDLTNSFKKFTYFTLANGKFKLDTDNNPGYGIQFQSTAGLISIDIYQPCNVTFSGNGAGDEPNGVKGLRVYLGESGTNSDNIITDPDVEKSKDSKKTYSITITQAMFEEADKDGDGKVILSFGRKTGNGTNITSIKIEGL